VKELEDHSWFPSVLRNFQTEFIGFVVSRFNMYDGFMQHIKTLSLPLQSMTDLCSGSGEPAITVFRKSKCFNSLTLTDKFPNALQFHDDKIFYESKSVDVLEMKFKPGTYYTMFNAFHHFKDEDKLKIANKIIASGSAAFFVEILEPGIICFLKVIFITTVGSVILTPFIRPFSLKRLLFTYIIPVNILTIMFDGIVSVFKSRSVKQYTRLFANDANVISISKLKNGLNTLTVIQISVAK
jgi:hypothetical protein